MFSDKYIIKQLCSYFEQDFWDFDRISLNWFHDQILTVLRNFWGTKRFFLPKMFVSINIYGFKRKTFWSLLKQFRAFDLFSGTTVMISFNMFRRIFWRKTFYLKRFLCIFMFGFWAKKFRHSCQNNILLVQINFCGRICFCKDLFHSKRSTIPSKKDKLLRKCSSSVVKNELYASEGSSWRKVFLFFFPKKGKQFVFALCARIFWLIGRSSQAGLSELKLYSRKNFWET